MFYFFCFWFFVILCGGGGFVGFFWGGGLGGGGVFGGDGEGETRIPTSSNPHRLAPVGRTPPEPSNSVAPAVAAATLTSTPLQPRPAPLATSGRGQGGCGSCEASEISSAPISLGLVDSRGRVRPSRSGQRLRAHHTCGRQGVVWVSQDSSGRSLPTPGGRRTRVEAALAASPAGARARGRQEHPLWFVVPGASCEDAGLAPSTPDGSGCVGADGTLARGGAQHASISWVVLGHSRGDVEGVSAEEGVGGGKAAAE